MTTPCNECERRAVVAMREGRLGYVACDVCYRASVDADTPKPSADDLDLDDLERKAKAATPGPWDLHAGRAIVAVGTTP